jgi:hypothetical protein
MMMMMMIIIIIITIIILNCSCGEAVANSGVLDALRGVGWRRILKGRSDIITLERNEPREILSQR